MRSRWGRGRVVLAAAVSGSLVMLVLGGAAAVPSSAEPALSCQGVAATIVGSQDHPVEGSSQRDVIVSNGASRVDAGGGDDLICVTGHFDPQGDQIPGVDAGAGDDVVDTTGQVASSSGVSIYWSSGSDTIVGGQASDIVDLCGDIDFGIPGGIDRAPDVVNTGAGDDRVDVCAQGGEDVVDLGDGDDQVWLIDPAEYVGHLNAGPGWNELVIREDTETARGTAWHIDLAAGLATATGTVSSAFSWDRFGRVDLPKLRGRLDVVGSAGPDVLTVGRYSGHKRIGINAALGGGKDRISLYDTDPRRGSVIDLGDGTDALTQSSPRARDVSLDLARRELLIRRTRHHEERHELAGRAAVRGVEAARVTARIVRLTGTTASESLHANGCDVRVEGGDGDDQIVLGHKANCMTRTHRGVGGPGSDVLRGQRGDDVLIGGDGDDEAEGRGGFDTCDVEASYGCETADDGVARRAGLHGAVVSASGLPPFRAVVRDGRSSPPGVDIATVELAASIGYLEEIEQTFLVNVPGGLRAGQRFTVWFDRGFDEVPDGHYELTLGPPKSGKSRRLRATQSFELGGAWSVDGRQVRCTDGQGMAQPAFEPDVGDTVLDLRFDLVQCLQIPWPASPAAGFRSMGWRAAVRLARGNAADMAPNDGKWSPRVAIYDPR